MSKKVKWLKRPTDKEWFAANVYLGLLGYGHLPPTDLSRLKIYMFKAKDILRASGLQLLRESNEKVESKVAKIKHGKPLSPIILVRTKPGAALVIADGYHRICALYYFDKEVEIPCVIRTLK